MYHIMTTASEIAGKLSDEEIVYLYIVNEFFCMHPDWTEQIKEDIKATGGEFTDGNSIYLDFDVNAQLDPQVVKKVIEQWEDVLRKIEGYGEMIAEQVVTFVDEIDEDSSFGARFDDFPGVVFRTEKDTGSHKYEVHGEDDAEVFYILGSADSKSIVDDFSSPFKTYQDRIYYSGSDIVKETPFTLDELNELNNRW